MNKISAIVKNGRNVLSQREKQTICHYLKQIETDITPELRRIVSEYYFTISLTRVLF